MNLLLTNATVIDSGSSEHESTVRVLIEEGMITALGSDVRSKDATEINLEGKLITPGWVDLNAHFCDPGFEHKEDLESGAKLAAQSGFTDIQLMPNTNPPVQSKSQIDYIKRHSDQVDFHPCVAISEDFSESKLNDLFDLKFAGAASYGNGDQPITNERVLINVLTYTKDLGLPIIQNPYNIHLSAGTQMHEGVRSTELGMKGDPSISEELLVRRDLELLKYAGGHLHFTRISTKGAVQLIREAKARGLNISCDVAIHNLLFTDESIVSFDTNFKNLPPYRSQEDRLALIEGLIDDTIEAISSNHRPQDMESKDLEFDLAEPGTISLQTFYPALVMLAKQHEIPFPRLIAKVTDGPRNVLGQDRVSISVNCPAKITILDPSAEWVLKEETNASKSKNSPFWEEKLKGRAVGIINGNSYSLPL